GGPRAVTRPTRGGGGLPVRQVAGGGQGGSGNAGGWDQVRARLSRTPSWRAAPSRPWKAGLNFAKAALSSSGSPPRSFPPVRSPRRGTVVYADGRVYEGGMKEGRLLGQGRMQFPDGSVVEGQYADGELDRHAKRTDKDGTVFEGQFAGGAPSGEGELRFPDGRVLVARYQNGGPQGIGTLRYPDGREAVQVFRRGQIVRSIPKQRFEAEQAKRKALEEKREETQAGRQRAADAPSKASPKEPPAPPGGGGSGT